MITVDLQRILTFHSGYQPGEIDQRTRPLREHDLIPHGPRGPNAPALEPLHAALIVLTMVSRRASDSGAVAMRAMDLKVVPRKGCTLDAKTLLAPLLATGLTVGGKFLRRVEITSDGAMAWVTIVNEGKPMTMLLTDSSEIAGAAAKSEEAYDNQGAALCNHRFVMGPAVIDEIMLEIKNDDPPAGYASSEKIRQRGRAARGEK